MAARRPLPAASLWLHAILLLLDGGRPQAVRAAMTRSDELVGEQTGGQLLAGNSPIAPLDTRPAEHVDGRRLFGRKLVPAPVLVFPLGRRAALAPLLTGFAWRLASTRRR